MTGNLDAFCERCGKTAISPTPAGTPGDKVLRRLGLGNRSGRIADASSALRLCLGCRGYICAECWNEEASVCQTCQPLAGVGVSVTAFVPEEDAPPGPEIVDDAPPQTAMDLAWPEMDLHRVPVPMAGYEPVNTETALVAIDGPEYQPIETLKVAAETEVGETFADEVVEQVAAATEPAPGDPDPDEPNATADSFEDRLAEIVGRIQAIGASTPAQAYAETPAEAAETAEPEDVSHEPEFVAEAVEVGVEEPEVVAEAPEVVAEEPQLALDEPPMAAAHEQSVPEEPAEEPVADQQVAEDLPVLAAEETQVGADVDPEPVATFEAPTLAQTADETAESAVDQPTSATAPDTEETLWAAVLLEADPATDGEPAETDTHGLSRVFQARRLRRRVARPLPRRLRRPEPATETQPSAATPPAPEPAPDPSIVFVEPAGQPGPPRPPRVLKLPPALSPQPPALTQPWPMPAPPAFLPPPPPTMSAIQPAPARFRPQVVPAELPKPPATRPCGNCGLELSAKVTFCRRCGTRQPPAA
jgi:hypothetical protein